MLLTRNRALAWALVAVAALVIAGVGWYYFAPKPTSFLDEPAPAAAETLASGSFQGADAAHDVAGSVTLLRDADGFVLRFEDYDATSGPDVYFYLTKEPGAYTTGAVEGDGIRIPTGSATGQATLRGSFNVRVPDGVDATQYGGLSVWCDRFGVLFGSAPLA